MATRLKIGLIAVMLVVASGAFAATAFTSGNVERQATVGVVSDDTGLIALQDNTSGSLVFQNSTGALGIDFSNGSATGVNTAAHFEIGDRSNVNSTHAFNVTNNDNAAHTFYFEYTKASSFSDDGDTDANVKFRVYDETGSFLGEATEENGRIDVGSVGAGNTVYVIVVVDTYGVNAGADLSGNLNVSV